MSFLLGKPRNRPTGTAGQRPMAPGRGGGGGGRPRSSFLQSKQPGRGGGGGGQVQQLLQRRSVPQQQQRQVKKTSQQPQQQATAPTKQDLQGVISMDEVMEDLRVLEQQQRESQRRLEDVKALKQLKLDQRAALDSKLSSLKYANGQQRAQLERERDVLSRSTRELSSLKLSSQKSADSLKNFDASLKKALLSARSLLVLRRKMDSAMLLLENELSVIARKQSLVKEGLHDTKQRRDALVKKKEFLVSSIRVERSKATSVSQETTSICKDITDLEKELGTAQQLTASTKLRAKSIATEIDSEGKRHAASMQAMETRLQAIHKAMQDKHAKDKATKEAIQVKTTEQLEAWSKCVEYQRQEGHALSPKPTKNGPALVLNVDPIKQAFESEKDAVRAQVAVRDGLKESIARLGDQVAELESKDDATRKEAAAILEKAQVALQVQQERKSANDAFLAELEQDRKAIADLRRSAAELKESKAQEKQRLVDKIAEQTKAIDSRKIELDDLKASLTTTNGNIEKLARVSKQTKEENAAKLKQAKDEADQVRSTFEQARAKVESLENSSDSEFSKGLDVLSQGQAIMLEEENDEIEQLLEEYPVMAMLDISYNPDKTTNEQTDEILATIRADCDARKKRARADYEAIKRKADQHQEAERQRKRKEEAERKRKEEAKRKRKEAAKQKEEAERKRKEEAERKRREEAEQKEEAERKRKEEVEKEEAERRERKRKEAAEQKEEAEEDEEESEPVERKRAKLEETIDEEEEEPATTIMEIDEDDAIVENKEPDGVASATQDLCSDLEQPEAAASQKKIRWEGLSSDEDDDDDDDDVVAFSAPALPVTTEPIASRSSGQKKAYGRSQSRAYGRRGESSSSGTSKKGREKELKPALKSTSRRSSDDGKKTKSKSSRSDGDSVGTKQSSSSKSRASSRKDSSQEDGQGSLLKKSKDRHSTKPSSRASKSDSSTSCHKSPSSRGTRKDDDRSVRRESKSSSREGRETKRDDARLSHTHSRSSSKTSRSSRSKSSSSSRDGRESKRGARKEASQEEGHGSHVKKSKDRHSTKSSSSRGKDDDRSVRRDSKSSSGRGARKDDNRSDKHTSRSKSSSRSSKRDDVPSSKSSSSHSKRDDDRSTKTTSSRKSSTSQRGSSKSSSTRDDKRDDAGSTHKTPSVSTKRRRMKSLSTNKTKKRRMGVGSFLEPDVDYHF